MSDRLFAAWGTPASPARHALLRVEAQAYALMLAERPDLTDPLLKDWVLADRPLIARRRAPCDARDLVPAGVPLPPAHGKKRIALQLAPGAILSLEPPPLLADCAAFAPAGWRPAIEAILHFCNGVGVEPRVFGALAWSALTGLDYLSPSSDLDLLFAVAPDADVAALLEGLARIDAGAPMRLDGEILRLDVGFAGNWRELAAGAEEILVKTIKDVALWPRRAFLTPGVATRGARDWRAAS
ncbi:Phosphoribosyl-dephospho-CoA transferase [Methylocella tundrae]|uniref:Phosphoribosyl-dephospho-CoA transferase n=1 Tax=Methylocella tundrae TaxID=227605 RepID=A0A8B6M1C8_METTU|nr:malonate decarboxylase holo-[acyl-carrier-protein] synthase [Methylocella tundrae]VTZ48279.1 Phosphoribosyl-dephospho-CoA transferase [Methylocella tundrae]